MSRLLCCLRARTPDMGAALSHPQEGEACEGVPAAPPTMADVIRERKKKAGGAGLGTLRRRIAAAARRPRDQRPDRGCEHSRFIRGVVGSWRLAEVFLLAEELEAGAALRDLATQADLAREPASALHQDLANALHDRWWCDVELLGVGWSIPAHRSILAARCTYFRDLLNRYPPPSCRVPLEGACAGMSLEEVEACVCALYTSPRHPHPHCTLCNKWDRGVNNDGDLDIINVENSNSCRCRRWRRSAAAVARLAPLLGFDVDSLHQDMRYLLDSGEASDARLVFRLEGGCSSYGFHSALELPCHRVVLAARSRFFRSVMSRRSSGCGGGGGGSGAALVTLDEKVLPRRFARALLHAAYTDQVDLTLVGHPPGGAATASGAANANGQGSAAGGASGWPGVARNNNNANRPTPTAMLDDAFQLYEIARFLEMAIVVQGCEDAVVEALSPETLPQVLRWAAQPHASPYVHRQAMRYLRDEFPTIMSSSWCWAVPRCALAEALRSPFLQAAEPQALRALLRWAAHQPQQAAQTHQTQQTQIAQHAQQPQQQQHSEPNVVWHTGQSVSRRGGRRREVSDAVLREILSSLIPLLRIEHIPPDNELLNQLIRRGIVCASLRTCAANVADAWLARGSYRPPRCFLPYLDEIKALLEDQAVPEAEVSRVRRARYLHRIPDTLYMVAAARNVSEEGEEEGAGDGGPATGVGAGAAWGPEAHCVSPRVLAQLRARARELSQAPPALTALTLHRHDRIPVYRQIALRAVREMSLPDTCAELLLTEIDNDRERGTEEWESPPLERRVANDRGERGEASWDQEEQDGDCCRTASSNGSLRCPSAGSLGTNNPLHIPLDNNRTGTCRREVPSRPGEGARASQVGAGAAPHLLGAAPHASGATPRGRLSDLVPDVAMAPNANTHLLTNRDYYRHPRPTDYGGVVLQLDLGDGATHTPRPGSRAQRANAAAHINRQHRPPPVISCSRNCPDEDELRAAIELSVIRAYTSFHHRSASPTLLAMGAQCRVGGRPHPHPHSTLPHHYRHERHDRLERQDRHERRMMHHQPVGRLNGAGVGVGVAGAGGDRPETPSPPPAPAPAPSPSPPRIQLYEYAFHRRDFRMDRVDGYGASGSGARGSSPGGGGA